jgi:hypothetical protein
MDRSILLAHLARAEQHLAESDIHVQRQREIVARLARDGDAEELGRAQQLLARFEEMHATHAADRERVLQGLR